MTKADKFNAGGDDWESRKLGREEEFVKRVRRSHDEALDKALGLHMISIRLQKQLIDDLKFIATAHGIGYQPLIRDILSRFVVHEKKQIIREAIERQKLERQAQQLDDSPRAQVKRRVAA